MSELNGGKIRLFDPDKGYGFITPEAGGADIFFRVSKAERQSLPGLGGGSRVLYAVLQERDGRVSAISLTLPSTGTRA